MTQADEYCRGQVETWKIVDINVAQGLIDFEFDEVVRGKRNRSRTEILTATKTRERQRGEHNVHKMLFHGRFLSKMWVDVSCVRLPT